MKRLIYLLPLAFAGTVALAQENHVFSGAEQTTFGSLDLGTPPGQTWSTDRSASPGYFSAAGSGTFTGAADNANVNGYVKYYANNAPAASFTFPVGTGADLRSLTVSGTIPATAEIAAAWIAGNPSGNLDPTGTGAAAGAHSTANMGTGILSVNTAGQWDWQDIGSNAAGMTITVSIPNVSATTAGDLRLVGWNGTQWVNLSATQGNTAASGNTENSTLTGTMQAGITAIAIGAASIPLPVDWLAFTATHQGADVVLDWATAREANTDRFEAEYSTDGRSFSKIGSVAAAGNSSIRSDYTFTHKDAAAAGVPELFYRIRQWDKDGRYTYSVVRRVQPGMAAMAMTIYPNPLQQGAALQVKAQDIRSIEIFAANGARLWQGKYEGVSQATLPTGSLSVGVYWIKVNGTEHTARFVVR